MSSEITTLRNQLRRKDEFIATLGHELRNPLGRSIIANDGEVARYDNPCVRKRCGDHLEQI